MNKFEHHWTSYFLWIKVQKIEQKLQQRVDVAAIKNKITVKPAHAVTSIK